jgi:plasmid maintenance system antidote protein VapI
VTGDRKGQHSILIMLQKRGITADTALRLARCFGASVEM